MLDMRGTGVRRGMASQDGAWLGRPSSLPGFAPPPGLGTRFPDGGALLRRPASTSAAASAARPPHRRRWQHELRMGRRESAAASGAPRMGSTTVVAVLAAWAALLRIAGGLRRLAAQVLLVLSLGVLTLTSVPAWGEAPPAASSLLHRAPEITLVARAQAQEERNVRYDNVEAWHKAWGGRWGVRGVCVRACARGASRRRTRVRVKVQTWVPVCQCSARAQTDPFTGLALTGWTSSRCGPKWRASASSCRDCGQAKPPRVRMRTSAMPSGAAPCSIST